MCKIVSRVTITKPANEVYAKFMDESQMSKWLSGYKSSKLIHETDNGIGNIYEMTFEESGKDLVFTETVIAMIENKQYAFTIDHSMMKGTNNVTFDQQDGNTIVTMSSEIKGKSLWKILIFLMKGSMTKRQQENFESFKALF